MKRYIVAGIVLFVVFALAFAPAGILDRAADAAPGLDLVDTRGTVWRGNADLLIEGLPMGQLSWDFEGSSLLLAAPSYAWHLTRPDGQLSGTAGSSISRYELNVEGQIEAEAFNAFLDRYDIRLSGDLDVAPTHAAGNHDTRLPDTVTGQVDWSGGTVLYTLSGMRREVTLPPLTAYLDNGDNGMPEAVVYAAGEDTPLLIASLQKNGFARIGITKLFTKLLQTPYPGSDPDHAIVLEVEEQVF